MNVVNRIGMTLLALLLLILGIIVMVAGLSSEALNTLLGTFGLHLSSQLGSCVGVVSVLLGGQALSIAGGGLVLGILGLLLLVLELHGLFRRQPPLVLAEDAGGRVTVEPQSVRQLVEYEAARVSGVRAVRARVRREGTGMAVICHVAVLPERNLPEVVQEVQERVRHAVEELLGQPLASVAVETEIETAPRSAAMGRAR